MNDSLSAIKTPVWHKGEIMIQHQAGVAEMMSELGGRVLRDYLLDQHRDFFPQLPFIVAGTVDAAGKAWATLLSGVPGFLESPDPKTLRVNATADPADPASGGLTDGAAIGLLGIQLETRRRNRLNGIIHPRKDGVFDVRVAQSYGNCPKYIRLRDVSFVRDPRVPAAQPAQVSDHLDERAIAIIKQAETFFVASYIDEKKGGRQVDVSHRGGKPGFVRVDNQGVLTIPDFIGNKFFNTLGNIHVNPKSGLTFVDFETGDLLQLTGQAEVIFDASEIAAYQGAERLWRFITAQAVFRPGALPLRVESRAGGASPFLSKTGGWDQTP